MATLLPMPRADIPIGRDINGNPVMFDPSWYRSFFTSLLERVSAGTSSMSNGELEAAVQYALTEPLMQRAPAVFEPADILSPVSAQSTVMDIVLQTAPAADLGDLVFQPH